MSIRKRILLLEDDLAIQDAIQIILEQAGYCVELHIDGEDILKGNYQPPCLFVLDKQVPGVDGLDICRYLKSREQNKHIPVVILSASPQNEKLVTAAGADAFLEKPFKKQTLLDMVTRFVG